MPFCPNCGTPVENLNDPCPACNKTAPAEAIKATETPAAETPVAETPVAETPAAPVIEPVIVPEQPKVRQLNTAQLVCGIINSVCCCMPLGVAGIIMAVMAKDSPDDATEEKRLNIAKILNIIGTVGGAIVSILYVIYYVIIAASMM